MTEFPAWMKKCHAPMGFHVGGVDRRFQKLVEGRGPVLNVGAKHTAAPGWVNVDIVRHAPSIHVLGDARRLPFRSGVMAGVVMKFVLEHVPDPEVVVREVHRVLAPGGCFWPRFRSSSPFTPTRGISNVTPSTVSKGSAPLLKLWKPALISDRPRPWSRCCGSFAPLLSTPRSRKN